MQNVWKQILYLFHRFRYPFSTPEDVAKALGARLPNHLSFNKFLCELTHPSFCPSKLSKYMPREKAEAAFSNATECFQQNNFSLFSYYFKGGWMEFVLYFDNDSRLRRIYLHHQSIKDEFEIKLP